MSRQVVYRFNGDKSAELIETDLDDSIPIPSSGSHCQMNGKSWCVALVITQQTKRADELISTIRIFLRDPE